MDAANVIRRRLLAGAMGLPVAALGGCVVAPYGPYYRPSTSHPGATYRRAWCQGQAGPQTGVELILAPGVTLAARAERDYVERQRPELPLRVTLTLPATAPVRFEGSRMKVVDVAGGRLLGEAIEARVFRHVALAPDGWVDAARLRPGGQVGTPASADEPAGSARLRISMEPGFTPDRLIADGLVAVRDGGTLKMPAVSMHRPASKASGGDYRSGALHARLQERAAACRRDTPRLACDNIVEYSSISFLEEDAGARWSGRWHLLGEGAGARIAGDIVFAPRAAARWRLAAPTLNVRDLAGTTRTARVVQLDLALDDRVPLDTPLFAHTVEGLEPARLTIEVPLPGAAPDFEVVLPDLRVGERRIAIPPLRFERRAFDGGVEPFNC